LVSLKRFTLSASEKRRCLAVVSQESHGHLNEQNDGDDQVNKKRCNAMVYSLGFPATHALFGAGLCESIRFSLFMESTRMAVII
jgi:hypothetical protein